MIQAWFDRFPLWVLFIATFAMVGLVIEVGFRFGRRARTRPSHEAEPPVTLVVTAVLGLVAFIVGFTLGLAETRYETRREAKFSEADAISTAYLRAKLLPDSSRTVVRRLLRRAASAGTELSHANGQSNAIAVIEHTRDSLWAIATAEANANPESQGIILFLESLGQVFDVFEREVFVARHGRIPVTIWVVLVSLTAVGMGLVGYHAGLTGSRPTWGMAALALALATITYVIADLDRPEHGTLRLSRESISKLHRSFLPNDTIGDPPDDPPFD